MYPIPEAGGAYMQQYRQPEVGGGQYVSNTCGLRGLPYMQLYRQLEGGEGGGELVYRT
jgi:hypothetical protein